MSPGTCKAEDLLIVAWGIRVGSYLYHSTHKDYLKDLVALWEWPSQPCKVDWMPLAALPLPDLLCPQVSRHLYLTPSMVAWYGLVTSWSVE